MTGFASALVATDLTLLPASSATGAPGGFPTAPQEQGSWCWAAVSAGLLQALGRPPRRQCEIVSAKWGASCPPNPPIDKTASLDDVLGPILNLPADWRGPSFFANPAQAYATICASIDANKPVPILIEWADGHTRHYVCAFGHTTLQGEPALWVYDPSPAWAPDQNRRLRTTAAMRQYSEAPDKPGSFGYWSEAYLLR